MTPPHEAPGAQAETHFRRGDLLHEEGRYEEARRALEAALVVDPDHWMARYTLAVVLQDLGLPADAAVHYERALAARPDHAKAWNNFGAALQYLGRFDDAIAAFRRALAIDPGHAGAAANLSGQLGEIGTESDLSEARVILDPFTGSEPPGALDLRRAMLLPMVVNSAETIIAARWRLRDELAALLSSPPQLRDPLREIGRTPFYLAYQPECDREILETLGAIYRLACPSLTWMAPHCLPGAIRPVRRRIRIGFASFFLYSHSIGRVIDGLVEHLPRDRFEVCAIFLGGRADDEVATRLAASADLAVETLYDVGPARETIANLQLDILCLPDIGMEPLSYFVGFSRLAPVQCTTWGHPETSGLRTIDWFVTTGWERPGAEEDYSERLYRLPEVGSPAWYRLPEIPPGRSRLEPTKGPRYFCAQTPYKFHPDHDEIWRRILAADPEARLYLRESRRPEWDSALQSRFARTMGAQACQVIWLPWTSRGDFMASFGAADVILDTLHFCGGNTSFEALALGKPLVTLPGAQMRSRYTAGMLEAIGVDELVARDADDYVRIAIQLGQDHGWRAQLEERIVAGKNRLFEDFRVVAGWSDFFEMAVRFDQRA